MANSDTGVNDQDNESSLVGYLGVGVWLARK